MSFYRRQYMVSLPRQFGVILLCLWLIAFGALPLFGVISGTATTALQVMAIVVGLVLLFERR